MKKQYICIECLGTAFLSISQDDVYDGLCIYVHSRRKAALQITEIEGEKHLKSCTAFRLISKD